MWLHELSVLYTVIHSVWIILRVRICLYFYSFFVLFYQYSSEFFLMSKNENNMYWDHWTKAICAWAGWQRRINYTKTLSTWFTFCNPTNELLDDALWLWFLEERRSGKLLSGPILVKWIIFSNYKMVNSMEEATRVHFIGISSKKTTVDRYTCSRWVTDKV